VSKHSAVLGLPNELAIPITADHQGMCRFSDKQSQLYVPVEKAISDLCQSIIRICKAEDVRGASKSAQDLSSQQTGRQIPASSSATLPGPGTCCRPSQTNDESVDTYSAGGDIRKRAFEDEPSLSSFWVSRFLRHYYYTPIPVRPVAPSNLESRSISFKFIGDVEATLEVPSSLCLRDVNSLFRAGPEGPYCLTPFFLDSRY
jgi:hypothetical protein